MWLYLFFINEVSQFFFTGRLLSLEWGGVIAVDGLLVLSNVEELLSVVLVW
jgi:hypothetical protein